jgi:hypothetical protein
MKSKIALKKKTKYELPPLSNDTKKYSPVNTAPGGNPGLKCTRIGPILKKFPYENNLKINNKPNPESFKLRIYTMKLSAGLPNLVRIIKVTTMLLYCMLAKERRCYVI